MLFWYKAKTSLPLLSHICKSEHMSSDFNSGAADCDKDNVTNNHCGLSVLWAIVGGVKASMDKPFALCSATVLDKEFHGVKKNTKTSLLLLYRLRLLVYITLMQGSGAAREYILYDPLSLTQR